MIAINMDKPKDCTECPVCSFEDDQCLLSFKYHRTWRSQYEDCPLIELKGDESKET